MYNTQTGFMQARLSNGRFAADLKFSADSVGQVVEEGITEGTKWTYLFAWYGRGPPENYPDRKCGALLCEYTSDLGTFISNYLSPQDNSNRCDTRYASFANPLGGGIKIQGLQAFFISCLAVHGE